MQEIPQTQIEIILAFLMTRCSRDLPLFIDRLWKSFILDFWQEFLRLSAPHVIRLLSAGARPEIQFSPEIYDSDGMRKTDVLMILQALNCKEYRRLFFEFIGRKFDPKSDRPLIRLFIEQQERYDPLMRFRMERLNIAVKTTRPPGVTLGILLATGDSRKVPPYRAEFGGYEDRLVFPVLFASDFTPERVKETGNNLFSVLMLASSLAAKVTGKNRKKTVPKYAEELKNLILSLNYGDDLEKAALAFVFIRFHLDDPDLEICPELLEVFKMAGLTYLTDHGDLLKKFTVDEIAKMNL
ncbi:MAG: hypothetical protein LBW85_05455, partial [Deltaproteobacteria bacterium]|nr:hypothetical protein [Deltaproteobacteria bacterium]